MVISILQLANSLICSALPILRQLGAQGGGSMLRDGDFSMLKVWAGLEARKFLQASAEEVSNHINLLDLSDRISYRSRIVYATISCHPISNTC